MVYNFNESLNGFCENKKIKSIPLYLFKDIKNLTSTKLISEKQKKFLNTSFALDTHSILDFSQMRNLLLVEQLL